MTNPAEDKHQLKEMLVFYNKKQYVHENIGYSPSAKKPKLVVDAWKQLGYQRMKFVADEGVDPQIVAALSNKQKINSACLFG